MSGMGHGGLSKWQNEENWCSGGDSNTEMCKLSSNDETTLLECGRTSLGGEAFMSDKFLNDDSPQDQGVYSVQTAGL